MASIELTVLAANVLLAFGWWHENYEGAPEDGSEPWLEGDGGDCGRRVVRGGSWGNYAWYLRSSYRFRFSSDYRHIYLGFRLVQDR